MSRLTKPLSGIGSQWQHDPSHFAFPRTSGLPRGTFRDPPRPRLRWIVLALAVALAGLAVTSMPLSDEEIGRTLHQVAR